MAGRSISKIVVKKLFGTYDYSLSVSKGIHDSNRLMILYGDNGSGKTTILEILFHLLAPEGTNGHRTALTQIPVSYFEIRLSNRDKVWLQRDDGQLIGEFTMGLKIGRARQHTVKYRPDDDGHVDCSPDDGTFLRNLSELRLALYFLADDRSLRFGGVDDSISQHFAGDYVGDDSELSPTVRSLIRRRRLMKANELHSEYTLKQSIRLSEQWLQSQAVRGASQGESNVNALYGEILSGISSLPLQSEVTPEKKIDDVLTRLQRLEDRSSAFARYGLAPRFQGKDIINAIEDAPTTHVAIITSIVGPYIDSVEKKLDALTELQGRIHRLVGLVNDFYTGKVLSYDVHKGFTISTKAGKLLQPEMLSSGERHLLLLFCNTVQALKKPCIFVIDEPELSLNIKWQRRLLSALLECAEDQPVQYILATHSFELLSMHRGNVIKLESE